MSEISYFKIEEDLASIFKNDSRLKSGDDGGQIGNSKLIVEVEEAFSANTGKVPWCGIYLDSWETNPEEERLAANNRFFTRLNMEIWLWDYALEFKQGAILRDRLFQKVKEVIKENRKIGNNVLITTFQGGEFDNAKTKAGTAGGVQRSGGFFQGVSIKLQMEIFE